MKIDLKDWKEFKIGGLFNIETCRGFDAGNLSLEKKPSKDFMFEFIGRTENNYGVQGYVKELSFASNKSRSITVSQVGTIVAQYRKSDYYTSQNMFKLTPKGFKITERQSLFIVTILNKLLNKYSGYSNYPTLTSLNNDYLLLPAKLYNDSPKYHPDWEFMEEYIKYIENKKIEEVDKFHREEIDKALKIAGLTEEDLDGDLSVEPAGMYCEFKIEELFDVLSSKKIFHATELDIYGIDVYRKNKTGLNPYVVRSELNNGVRGYISESSSFLNDENTISFAQDTFVAYYQKKPYFTGNKIKVLEPLFNPKERILLYIEAAINKSIASNTWGTGSTVNYIENIKLTLPAIDEKTPDFQYMEKAIYIYIYIYMASY